MDTITHILITAATGKTGRRIHTRLASTDLRVRAVSRSTDLLLDWEDRSTWDAVLDGIDVAYLAYSPDLSFPGSAEVVSAFAVRAVEHGVRRAVLLSGRGEPTAVEAEEAVRSSGIGLTVLRSSWMAQNFSEDFLVDAVRGGVVAVPASVEVGEAVVNADDVADAAVAALLDASHDGMTYELGGPRLLTLAEMAATLADATGRPVDAIEIPAEAWTAAAVDQGMPEELAHRYAALFAQILDGRNAHLVAGLHALLGRPGRDFAAVARAAAAEGAWGVAA